MYLIHPMVGNKHTMYNYIHTVHVIVWYYYVEYGVLEHCVCETLQC